MTNTGRDDDRIALVEAYAKAQGYWRPDMDDPTFTDTIELDLSTVVPSISGPKRPQDQVLLSEADTKFAEALVKEFDTAADDATAIQVEGQDFTVTHGDVFIAAITSCTNTSNPSVLIAAGLLARKAAALGLNRKPRVKTSFAPGSQVVTDYLD